MALETALAKVSMDVTDRRDPHKVYHMMAVKQLSAAHSGHRLAAILRDWSTGIANLNVTNPDFFKGLQAVLDSTDLETIKTYLRWQLVHGAPSFALPKAMYDADFDFTATS